MAPSRYDWKIVDWDVKPQYNQPTIFYVIYLNVHGNTLMLKIVWILIQYGRYDKLQ